MSSSTDYKTDLNCIFCKIVKGEIPSFKLIDTDRAYAFFDIGPLAKGHALVVPKYHGAKLHDIPDEDLTTLLPLVKKIAIAVGSEDYNVLQSMYDKLFPDSAVIPKPSASDEQGLVVGWPTKPADMAELKAYCEAPGFFVRESKALNYLSFSIPIFQLLQHVHFHMIPKPSASDEQGLVVGWPTKPADMAELKAYCEEIKNKL